MSACALYRIIQFKEAMTWTPVAIYDANGMDITPSCQFSWSTDGVCWIGWVTYENYNKIGQHIEGDFYLRVRFMGGLSKVLLGGFNTDCYNVSLDSVNIFLRDFCGETNLFQPYNNLDCALLLQQQLADATICMLGIPIYYIRVTPDVDTADYTFKEYVLHNVQSIKQIKMMVMDGVMPSSNPKLSEFDFDWENDWETELSKTQFATAFGDTAFPKFRDLVYIPMMKRLWEVNSAYDEKKEGLMWRSTTWKINLVKYNEKSNVDLGELESAIDAWTLNDGADVFGKAEVKEQERSVGAEPLSSPVRAATNLTNIFFGDSVRQAYTMSDISILQKQYNHRAHIVSRNVYKFKEGGEVTYQKGWCGSSGTLMFILETPGLGAVEKTSLMNFGEVEVTLRCLKGQGLGMPTPMFDISMDRVHEDKFLQHPPIIPSFPPQPEREETPTPRAGEKFIISFGELELELDPFSTYLVVLGWDKARYITSMTLYKHTCKEGVPIYMRRPEMYYFDFENGATVTSTFNNDLESCEQMPCSIHAWPVTLTNIKYYNTLLDVEETAKEAIKYTTTHENCVINDLARPIDMGHGYEVR